MKLERTILAVLEQSHPYMLTEATLHAEVKLRHPGPVTLTDLRADLAALETKRQAVSIPTEDAGHKWKITADGKARLAE